jgi:hypothetical protein
MAMATFNDELDEVPVKATTATAAAPAVAKSHTHTAPVAQTVAASDDENTPASKKEEEENLSTDFDDEKVYARTGQLNQCRPEKGKAARFSFVPKEWIAPQTAKAHWVDVPDSEGKVRPQRIRCLTPLGADADAQYCCEQLNEDGSVEVVALVVRYTNANPDTGKYDKLTDGTFPPVAFEIQFVRLSQFNMRQIKKLPDEDSNPFNIDIVMTHAEGRAFGYEFNRKANTPRWKSDPKVAEDVKKAVKKFLDGKVLKAKLGNKKNETEWKALLASRKVGVDAKLDNVEEL